MILSVPCLAAETNNDEKQPQMWNSYFDAMIHPAVVTLHLLPHGSIRCMHPFSHHRITGELMEKRILLIFLNCPRIKMAEKC